MTDQTQTSDHSSIEGSDETTLRKKARQRSFLCAGAGFALLGHRPLAILASTASMCVFAAFAWAILQPSAGALWSALVVLLVATLFWVGEQLTVPRVTPRAPGPAMLVAGYPFVVTLKGLAAGIVLVLILTHFGSLRLAGPGMSPTLEKGELVLYQKRADDERLRRGVVVVYKLSNQTAWGQPGWIIISRIMAVPGDRLSIQGAVYVVNGEAGPPVGPTGQIAPVISVPSSPEAITVPENCYFMVQDSPSGGFDSRILSWVQRNDIVSTGLYYLRPNGILKTVK
jgi:signal peptidase I